MQYSNPFSEGEYPSPLQGMRRSYEAFAADTARRRAEEGNQRQQMMMFAAKMIIGRREEEEERRYQETQEAEERKYQEGRAEVRFGRQKTIAELAGGRRLEEIEARGTEARKTALIRERARRKTELAKVKNVEDRTFLQSYYKTVDDLNQAETQLGKYRYRKPPPNLVFKKQQFENEVNEMKIRVNRILGLGIQQPSGADVETGAPVYPEQRTWAQAEAEFKAKGATPEEIAAARKRWFAEGGK